ncbi:CMRF35-like molecule 9 [Centropristis striata]|uniref:CMRF35-like molecule 9 n=1 Tax=Centropristis striata TaxID=184440 RepID=UPI0027E197F9|nr:CMRF35-like molecule 9 [Centropristis striata]
MIKICVYCCLLSALSVVEVKTLYINGRVGERVHFTCSGWDVRTNVKKNDKYFCYSPCTEDKHIITKAAFKRTTYKGRVELFNSGESLSVTFKNLHESDSGTYYCGVDRWGTDSFITVNIKVTDAKSSSPKATPKPLIVSTLSFSAPYSSTTSSDSSDIITDVFSSDTTLDTPTPTASAAPAAGRVTYLTVGAIVVITILMVLLKLVHKMRKHQLKVLSSARTPQEDAREAVEYDEIRPEDPTDSACLDANYSHHQDTAGTGNRCDVSFNSASRCEVNSRGVSAESRVTDPQCDLVYSVAQLPKGQIEPTGQSQPNQCESYENDSLYSLAQLPNVS